MSIPAFYSAYDPPPGVGTDCSGDKVLTKQEFKDECDINRIMARYAQTGELPPGLGLGSFGDFSDVGSYQEAIERVRDAEAQFAALPSKVRERFGNDAANMLAFVEELGASKDVKLMEEAKALGLLKDVVIPEGQVMVDTLRTIAENTKPVVPPVK